MIEKTKAIVLHQIKYTDSGIVAQVYTRKFGRQSFLIRGLRNKKSGRYYAHFQPMSVLELVMNYKESKGMQVLKESSVSYSPSDIYSNIKKSSVAIFLGEVLTSYLKEETPNKELFDFIEESIVYFDGCKEYFANFHIAFLAGLSCFLGFEPGRRTDRNQHFFDMLNGVFVTVPPSHGNFANADISDFLAAFFSTSYENINDILLTGSMRNEILEVIVRYYSIHLPGIKKIKSLEVLKEVFS